MINPQEKEFNVFGVISKNLRLGILISFLAISLTANVIMIPYTIKMQGDLYEKMLTRTDSVARDQANRALQKPIENVIKATERVNDAVDVTIDAAKTADSAGNLIIKKNIK